MRSTSRHRGGIYIVVLGMAMMVSVVALGGLMMARVQCRAASANLDFDNARLCARGGIEMAMYRIKSDPTWRTDLGNSAWYTNVTLGSGKFTVTAADPISGDITQATNHPVVLTSTGTAGNASYTLQVQVQCDTADLTCLEVSAISNTDSTVTNCTITSNQTVSSNNNFNADPNSTINANAEADVNFGPGGTYKGTKTYLTADRTMPDSTHVFDTYVANGTAITYTSLLHSNNTQIVPNSTMDTDISGWYVYSPTSVNAVLSRDTTQHKDGQASLKLVGRAGPGDVPAIDLPLNLIRNGDTYQISFPNYAPTTGTLQAELVIVTDSGTFTYTVPAVQGKTSPNWFVSQGSVTLSYTGIPQKATLTLLCTDNTCTINIDTVSLTDTSFPASAYVLDRCVLSPSSNPYGQANSQGIYVIDCNNKGVTIGPCRIVGTLVLKNVGPGSSVTGPISWEQVTAGYPALLTDTAITLNFSGSVGLSESTYGVNFNPAGTPYPYSTGTTNATANDAYPSVINGIVYTGGDLTLSGSPSFVGCLISNGKITYNATSVNLTYSNASFMNPPPGFSTGLPALKPVPGTWQRVTH